VKRKGKSRISVDEFGKVKRSVRSDLTYGAYKIKIGSSTIAAMLVITIAAGGT
jgi:hypothetical protein